jgi:tetratricopeptide (TPR) repeat protein
VIHRKRGDFKRTVLDSSKKKMRNLANNGQFGMVFQTSRRNSYMTLNRNIEGRQMNMTQASKWDQASHLYDQLLHWLYGKGNPKKALPFATQLESIFDEVDGLEDSIFGQECKSLIFETKGDLSGAIRHRKVEIRKIRRLREISIGTPSEAYALKNYGVADLSDRLDLLAELYFQKGDLPKAIATLEESKRLCEDNHVKFDGKDLLQAYQKAFRLCQRKLPVK